jgi:hypothetical protein
MNSICYGVPSLGSPLAQIMDSPVPLVHPFSCGYDGLFFFACSNRIPEEALREIEVLLGWNTQIDFCIPKEWIACITIINHTSEGLPTSQSDLIDL